LKRTSIKDLWKRDLDNLEEELAKFETEYDETMEEMRGANSQDGKGKTSRKGKTTTKKQTKLEKNRPEHF